MFVRRVARARGLIAAGLLIAVAAVARADMVESEPSLVAYWKLDDAAGSTMAADSGPSGSYTGTIGGAVTLGQPGAMERLGTSANFQPTTGTITVPYSAALNPSAFTIEAWAQVDERTYYHSPLYSRSGSGGSESGYNFYAASNDTWQFWTGDGPAGPGTWDVRTGPTVVKDQWVHLAGTHDGTTKTFYVNGCPVSTATVGFAPSLTGSLHISPGWNVAFDGNLDNIAVLSQGLGAQRVQDHYNSLSSYASMVNGNAPVAYWRLGEQMGSTAYDAAGTRDGTYGYGPAIRQITDTALTGDIDTCVDFDGLDDRVLIPHDSAFHPDSFTLEAWAKVEGDQGDWRTVMMSRADHSGTMWEGYNIYAGSNDKWQFWTGAGNTWDILTGPDVEIGEWVHLVCTFESSGSLGAYGELLGVKNLYVNGELFTNPSGRYKPLTDSGVSLQIGRGGNPFDGKIDEVAIYDYALDPMVIGWHYETGTTGHYVPEPATMSLLGLGALALLRRRRR